MAAAAVDILGILPGPSTKLNVGACDLLAGEAFAYAVSSAVAVVDVGLKWLAFLLLYDDHGKRSKELCWPSVVKAHAPSDSDITMPCHSSSSLLRCS